MKKINNPNAPATRGQTWAIFCATKIDVRELGLTMGHASDLIDKSMSGINITEEVQELINNISGVQTQKSTSEEMIESSQAPSNTSTVIATLNPSENNRIKPNPSTMEKIKNTIESLKKKWMQFLAIIKPTLGNE